VHSLKRLTLLSRTNHLCHLELHVLQVSLNLILDPGAQFNKETSVKVPVLVKFTPCIIACDSAPEIGQSE
jgi:hypothetical protein